MLPVHNERDNLVPLYYELSGVLTEQFADWEIVFVDDGSTDGSYERLLEIHDHDPHVNVIAFSANFGQSAALDAGIHHATGDVIVTMDADGQNDPSDIPKLVEKLRTEDVDCVVGWRQNREDPLGKAISSRIARVMRRVILGTRLHDFGCTLKAFRGEAARSLNLTDEMHRYIPPLLQWQGFEVDEMVVNHRARANGETKYGWWRLPKGFLDMLNVWFWQKYSGRPIHVFGGLGIASGLVGGAGGLYSVYLKLFEGVSLSDTALPLFSAFLILLGVQFFISGILADISIRNYFQLQESNSYRIRERHVNARQKSGADESIGTDLEAIDGRPGRFDT